MSTFFSHLSDPVPSTFNNSQTSAQEQLAQVQGELEIVNEKMNRAIDQLERELQCGICREVIVFVSKFCLKNEILLINCCAFY